MDVLRCIVIRVYCRDGWGCDCWIALVEEDSHGWVLHEQYQRGVEGEAGIPNLFQSDTSNDSSRWMTCNTHHHILSARQSRSSYDGD